MVIVVLLLSAIGGLSYVQIRDSIEEDAEATLRSSATLQADSIEEWIAGMETQTGAVASSDVLASGDTNRMNAYLDAALSQSSADVTGIHVVDRESERVLASTNDRYAAQPLSSRSPAWRDAIEDARAAGVGSSETAYEEQGRVLMAFASATPDGEAWVVVVGDAGRDVEQLHSTGVAVTTRVLTANGLDVFETRGNTPSDLASDPAFAAALDGESQIVERETTVLALAPVEGEEWVVVTEAPKAELYAVSRTVGRTVLVLIGASILTLGVVGFVLGRGPVAGSDEAE
jgi:methyl-accepting chemotaxis protein